MVSEKTKKTKMMGVVEYAATRKGWRGFSVNPSYIYKLIKQYERGEKDAAQIGFKPHPNGKGYLIEPY